MSNIKVGQKIRVTVRFADFDAFAGTDELIDPDTVVVALYKYDDVDQVFELIGPLTPVVRESLGVYYIDWTPTEDGKFRLLFIGSIPGATPSTIENPRDFFIGSAQPAVVLGSTVEYYFFGELDPLYLDPEVISQYYPEMDYAEVTEIIHRVSRELQSWFGENLTLTHQMQEYILASTLCALTRIHILEGGMNGFSTSDSFMLGDLQVTRGRNSNGRNTSNDLGGVSSWCELAALLKEELFYNRTGMKAVVKGLNYRNPIPSRALKSAERLALPAWTGDPHIISRHP